MKRRLRGPPNGRLCATCGILMRWPPATAGVDLLADVHVHMASEHACASPGWSSQGARMVNCLSRISVSSHSPKDDDEPEILPSSTH